MHFLASFLLFFGSVQSSPVIGGQDTIEHTFPYLVSLRDEKNEQFCGAGIIANNVIITARHCVDEDVSKITVVAGTNSMIEKESRFTFTIDPKHVYHFNDPRWLKNSGQPKDDRHDIAVVKLNGKIPIGNEAKILALPKEKTKEYLRTEFVGWGLTKRKGSRHPDTNTILKKLNVTVQQKGLCEDAADPNVGYLPKYELCTAAATGKGLCSGDSGSPLIHNGTVIGISVWVAEPCVEEDKPDYFADVHGYLDFIKYALAEIKKSERSRA